jgi:hypothetical protein
MMEPEKRRVERGIFFSDKVVIDLNNPSNAELFNDADFRIPTIYETLDEQEAFANEKFAVYLELKPKAERKKSNADRRVETFDHTVSDAEKKFRAIKNERERAVKELRKIDGVLTELANLRSHIKMARKALEKNNAESAAFHAFHAGYHRGVVVAQSLGAMAWSAERISKANKKFADSSVKQRKDENAPLHTRQDKKRDELIAKRPNLSANECAKRVAESEGGTAEAIRKRWRREKNNKHKNSWD